MPTSVEKLKAQLAEETAKARAIAEEERQAKTEKANSAKAVNAYLKRRVLSGLSIGHVDTKLAKQYISRSSDPQSAWFDLAEQVLKNTVSGVVQGDGGQGLMFRGRAISDAQELQGELTDLLGVTSGVDGPWAVEALLGHVVDGDLSPNLSSASYALMNAGDPYPETLTLEDSFWLASLDGRDPMDPLGKSDPVTTQARITRSDDQNAESAVRAKTDGLLS